MFPWFVNTFKQSDRKAIRRRRESNREKGKDSIKGKRRRREEEGDKEEDNKRSELQSGIG